MKAVIAAAVLAGACTPNPAVAPTTTSTTSASPTSTSSAETPERKAVAAYLAMWREMAAAAESSNWQAPELARYAAGDALSVITRSLHEDNDKGVVTKGRPTNDPKVTNVDRPEGIPTVVMIRDCGDDATWLKYRKGTDQLVDDEAGGRRSIIAEVKAQADGSWRVTRFAVQGVGSC